MAEDRLKIPRYPFEYGTHDIVEELKTKNRVIPQVKVNFDQAISKMLTKTMGSFGVASDKDRVLEILDNGELYKN